MKKFNRIISIILSICLLSVYPVFAQDTEAADVEQTTDVTVSESFKKLVAFGIMTVEDEVLTAEYITRAQFVQYLMKCCFGNGIYYNAVASGNEFADVTDATTGAKEIAAACNMGIVSKASHFRPDDKISVAEAAKLMTSVLGYGEVALYKGGYPTGYLNVASEQDLFENCTLAQQDIISVADFVEMLMNTLEAEVLEMSAVWKQDSNAGKTFTATSDRTLLEYAFGIYKAEGVVESNKYTSVNGATEMYEDNVEIAGVIYKENGASAGQLLGYNTEVYYSLDDTGLNRMIEYIAPYDNEVIMVESDDIARDMVTLTNFAYYSEAKDRVINEDIPKSATLIYNGGQRSLTVANITPDNGNVTLVDNNSDGNVDVIFVMNYRTILVSSVSINSGTVADLLGGTSIVLDNDADEYDVYIDIDGIPAALSSVNVRNVISYAESTGCEKNVKYAKVSTKTVSGTPEAIGEETVVINGNEYYIDSNLIQNISLKEFGVFYLDYSGKIVAKKAERDIVFGYFNRVIKGDGINDIVRAQIFTENNRWVELDFKDKINYNGASGIKSVNFYNDWLNDGNTGKLLTYTVDADGKVNMITEPVLDDTIEYSDAERNAIDQGVFRQHSETGLTLRYAYNSSAFRCFIRTADNASEFFVNDNTKVFSIPTDASRLDEFEILNVNDLLTSTDFTGVIPYNYDMFRNAGVVVLNSNSSTTVARKASFMFVDSVVKTLNSDNNAVDGIKGYYKGVYITLPVSENSVISNLSERPAKGDVIRFTMNANGDICLIEDKKCSFYDYSAHTPGTNDFVCSYKGTVYTPDASHSVSYIFSAGTVHYVDATKDRFIACINGDKFVQGVDAATAYYVYDTETDTYTEGSIADMEYGNRIFVRNYYGVADEIIIYH